MTNAKLLAKIKAEIERLKELHKTPTFKGDEYEEGGVNGYQLALDKLFSFLDTLESGSSEIPNDHEKAAAQYARDYTENDEGNGGDDWEDDIRITFIAGAKWQKEQMLKGAVPFYEILKAVPPGPERDKVRIIIVKEDEK